MAVITITADNFEEVRAAHPVLLLDFYADWCGPCRALGPVLDAVAEERPDITVGRINVDENPSLAAMFGVRVIPLLVVLRDGEETRRAEGLRPQAEVLALLD